MPNPLSLLEAQADFDTRIKLFEELLIAHNIDAVSTCGKRSLSVQSKLYAKGRTEPGPKVTNAKPGDSPHNYGSHGLAKDYIPVLHLEINGMWRKVRTYSVGAKYWVVFGICAKKAGLKWGGSFRKLLDRPHVEFAGWEKFRK
jgi:peptidoglycan L-alanyl-D-glutamate endopeptidase CwlK